MREREQKSERVNERESREREGERDLRSQFNAFIWTEVAVISAAECVAVCGHTG